MAPHATHDLSDFWTHDPAPRAEPALEGKLEQKCASLLQSTPSKQDGSLRQVSGSEDPVNELTLTVTDLQEVVIAVREFEKTGLALNLITPATFRLPTLSSKLRVASAQIHGREEHVLIRGLDSIKLTYMEKVIAHIGLTSHIGGKRAMSGIQGGDRTVLHHVTALSTAYFAHTDYKAPSNAAGPMLFHNDLGDIISLFTVSQCKTGGATYLASVQDIYEVLADTRPDVIETLTNDWIFESPSKAKGFEKRPIMYIFDGRVTMDCSRVRISGTPTRPRPDFLPPLSSRQLEALDLVQSLATRFARNVRLQTGDLLAFNNLGMVHARDGFIDDESSGEKRHLLRIIARDVTKAWTVPQPLDTVLRDVYAHEEKDEKIDIFRNPFMFAAGH